METSESVSLEDLFGEPIHVHTRAELIEDGDLIEASPRLVREAGILFPVCYSRRAYTGAIEWTEVDERRRPGYGQSTAGREWDVLYIAALAMRCSKRRNDGASTVPFQVYAVSAEAGKAVPHRLYVHVGPGDDAEPVLTILCEGED